MNKQELNEIFTPINRILTDNENKLDTKNLKKIIKSCDKAQEILLDKFRTEQYVGENFSKFKLFLKDSEEFPDKKLPQQMKDKFIKDIDKKYHKTIHIHKKVAEAIFEFASAVNLYIGEDSNHNLILCLKKLDNNYYQVSDTPDIPKTNCNNAVSFYNKNLLPILDSYIQKNSGDLNKRNTRRFEITKNVIEAFKNGGKGALLLFPVICVEKDPYEHRLTFIITFGNTKDELVINATVATAIYDKNNLCPPPDNSNC